MSHSLDPLIPDGCMKFGIFLAPFHDLRENPTQAMHRDMLLLQHLDELGYHEAWVGEHHSGGFEIIARYVMPRFQDSNRLRDISHACSRDNKDSFQGQAARAVQSEIDRYKAKKESH